jgi:hypothetical protein
MNRHMRGSFKLLETTTFKCKGKDCERVLRNPTGTLCQSVNLFMEKAEHYSLRQLLHPRCEDMELIDEDCLCPDHVHLSSTLGKKCTTCEMRNTYNGNPDQLIILFNSPSTLVEKPTVELPQHLASDDFRGLLPEIDPDAVYELAGVIVHVLREKTNVIKREGCDHYVAYRYEDHGVVVGRSWLKYDDGIVTEHKRPSEYLGARIALYQRLPKKPTSVSVDGMQKEDHIQDTSM